MIFLKPYDPQVPQIKSKNHASNKKGIAEGCQNGTLSRSRVKEQNLGVEKVFLLTLFEFGGPEKSDIKTFSVDLLVTSIKDHQKKKKKITITFRLIQLKFP